ncbi:hypothetical protein BHE74_00016798 [Ensete ventricosum]|nr:hypothetical protein BHE74_00016798 [Ensete ventricosum]
MQIATSDILFLSSLCIWISMSEFLFGYLRKFPSFTFFTLDYKTYDAPLIDYEYPLYGLKYSSASAIKDTPLKLSYVYQCVGCDSFHLQSLGRAINKDNSVKSAPGYGPVVPQECSDCGKKFNMAGPIWSAPMHDKEWICSILVNVKASKERYPV